MREIGSTVKTILILAAAIIVAFLLWKVIAFAISTFVTLVTILAIAGILYVAFVVVRSTMRHKDSRPRI